MSGTNLNKVANKLLQDATQELIIVNNGARVVVGDFVVEQDTDFVLSRRGRQICVFNSKKAAVAYAVSEYNQTSAQSHAIKRYDEQLSKHREDIFFYKHSLRQALKRKDIDREDMMLCRLDYAFGELQSAKARLMVEIKKVSIQ